MYVCLFSRVIKHSRFKAKKLLRGKKEDGCSFLAAAEFSLFLFGLRSHKKKQRRDLPFFLDKKSLITNSTTNTKGVFFFSSSLKRAVR